ncbi:ATP-binding protein [Nakamurella sp. GG22]
MALRIRLLGAVEISDDGAPLRIDSSRATSLLAYLLLHRDAPQPRAHLAVLLWPDTTDAQARTNLRHVLHILRRTLPDADQFVDVTARTLHWRADAPWELDVAEFDAALAETGEGPEQLQRAVELYRGELLPGCYDDWLLTEREQIRRRFVAALRRLVELLQATGQDAQALSYAEQLLIADPLDESTYRLLMRLHSARGDRARALRVYHACTSTLERELGVAPSAATRQAYEALVATEKPGAATPALVASPFVGRSRERAQLTSVWKAAESGRASLVLVSGEAGIGKTRLVEDLRGWCARRGAATARARSYAAEGALAYGPITAWLRSAALRGVLPALPRPHLVELARLLPELLAEIPDLPAPAPLPENDLRHALFDAVARAVLAAGRPLLLILDDIHWCDRETLLLLHYLLRTGAGARMLVVATARFEDVHDELADLLRALSRMDRLSTIELTRLTLDDTASLAARLSGATAQTPAAERLWRETEGNPLFVVEAVRAGWPSGGSVTPKVQAVIESRLAQLSDPARELVGVAAAIGRDFTVDVLTAAADRNEDAVVESLDELWRRRIVREQGDNLYDFSHDKIRAVAYAGVSPIRRRQHHRRIARALELTAADAPGPVSAQIATHFELGGAPADSVDWFLRAAEASHQLSADTEAVRLLDRASVLLATLPPSRERNNRELKILTALPAPLASVEGYASSRLSLAQQRALDLAEALGSELAPSLVWSLAFAALSREDFADAERFAGELLERGRRDGDDVLEVEGACLQGLAAFWQADLASARGHFERALERYDPAQRTAHLLRYGQDPGVVSLARLGNTLWFLGDADGAVARRDAALGLADVIDHPLTTAAALVFSVLLAVDMGDEARIREYSGRLARLDHEAAPIRVATRALLGYVSVLDGRPEEGLRAIRDALVDAGPHPPAPGLRAMLERLRLAAAVAVPDPEEAAAAADQLLRLGGPGRLWAAAAHRYRSGTASRTVGNA